MFQQSSWPPRKLLLNSREKIASLGKELMDAQSDIAMAKQSGSSAPKKSRNDREIDGILGMSNDVTKGGTAHKGSNPKSSSGSTTGGSKTGDKTSSKPLNLINSIHSV